MIASIRTAVIAVAALGRELASAVYCAGCSAFS